MVDTAKNLEARIYFRHDPYRVDRSLPAMHQRLHDQQTTPCVLFTKGQYDSLYLFQMRIFSGGPTRPVAPHAQQLPATANTCHVPEVEMENTYLQTSQWQAAYPSQQPMAVGTEARRICRRKTLSNNVFTHSAALVSHIFVLHDTMHIFCHS